VVARIGRDLTHVLQLYLSGEGVQTWPGAVQWFSDEARVQSEGNQPKKMVSCSRRTGGR
jgi:hypothetical protein